MKIDAPSVMRWRLLLVAGLCVSTLGWSASPVRSYDAPSSDAAAWLYSSSTIVDIDLGIPAASRALLGSDPYGYVAATFSMTAGAESWGPWNIQLKLKGRSSYRWLDKKSAFKLKFPSSAQRVNGLKKMTLNNMVQDPSSLHETLAYELFRAMGIPAPRTGYAVVTVDGEDYGLHLNVETLDSVALPKWYGPSNTAHLYEGSYGKSSDPDDAFDGHYEVDEGSEEDRADLIALISASRTHGGGWLSAVEEVADLDEMLLMFAVERYVGHWDGYTGRGVNNYYLHSTPAGIFTLLPWGVDQTFSSRLAFDGDVGGRLFVACMVEPMCFSRYLLAVGEVARAADALRLAERAATLFASLEDEIAADSRKEYSVETAESVRDETIAFFATRSDDVADWLQSLEPLLVGAAPTVVGGPLVGSASTATGGEWSDHSAITLGYQWYACRRTGPARASQSSTDQCSKILGATSSVYVPNRRDRGKHLRIMITASSTSGRSRYLSATSPAVFGNVSPPRVSGLLRTEAVIHALPGRWAGAVPIESAIQWYACSARIRKPSVVLDGRCTALEGERASTLAVSGTDRAGKFLLVGETATNPAGSITVYSASPRKASP